MKKSCSVGPQNETFRLHTRTSSTREAVLERECQSDSAGLSKVCVSDSSDRLRRGDGPLHHHAVVCVDVSGEVILGCASAHPPEIAP